MVAAQREAPVMEEEEEEAAAAAAAAVEHQWRPEVLGVTASAVSLWDLAESEVPEYGYG